MDKALPNFSEMTGQDGKVYGKYNKVTSINPYTCYFIARYPNGTIIEGNDFINTGWDNIPNGLSELSYRLSTGHIIKIPKAKAYLPLIECSSGVDGSRVFHNISVKCLGHEEIVVYKIILKKDNIAPFNIGDVVISKEPVPSQFNNSWKFTS